MAEDSATPGVVMAPTLFGRFSMLSIHANLAIVVNPRHNHTSLSVFLSVDIKPLIGAPRSLIGDWQAP